MTDEQAPATGETPLPEQASAPVSPPNTAPIPNDNQSGESTGQAAPAPTSDPTSSSADELITETPLSNTAPLAGEPGSKENPTVVASDMQEFGGYTGHRVGPDGLNPNVTHIGDPAKLAQMQAESDLAMGRTNEVQDPGVGTEQK